jgi:hypothetical protein
VGAKRERGAARSERDAAPGTGAFGPGSQRGGIARFIEHAESKKDRI